MIIPFKCTKVRVTSPFGNRTLNGAAQFHTGYDLVGVGSYEITAARSGRVVQSRMVTDKANPTWQWGHYVCVRGDDSNYYYYCHMKSRAVKVGDIVNVGDKLGIMGNTGYSFGAHLHFEVRTPDGKTKINPEAILGIPNKTGLYSNEKSQLDQDLDILVEHQVINTPEYWRKTAPTVRYLPELLNKVATRLRR